jgi:cyanate permease
MGLVFCIPFLCYALTGPLIHYVGKYMENRLMIMFGFFFVSIGFLMLGDSKSLHSIIDAFN